MTQWLIAEDFVLILATNFLSMNVSFFLKLVDDSLHRAFGNAHLYSNFPEDHVGIGV